MKEIILQKSNFRCRENIYICRPLRRLRRLAVEYVKNIDGAEAVRVAHDAILVSRMHLATIALLCKQTTDNFRTRNPPEPRWRHLLGNWILFISNWENHKPM